MKNSVSRRGFFRVGMGAAGTLVASRTLAELCGKTTGEQPLGPFFQNQGLLKTLFEKTEILQLPSVSPMTVI